MAIDNDLSHGGLVRESSQTPLMQVKDLYYIAQIMMYLWDGKCQGVRVHMYCRILL